MHANNRKFMRLYVVQAGVCADCSAPVTPDRLTIHHVPPLREGGNDSSASNVLLCGVCHGQRHATPIAGLRDVGVEVREKSNLGRILT